MAVQRPKDAPSLAEKVVAIDTALTAAKVPHAVGGALALAYYAEPRATIDVDLNVFVPTTRWPAIRDALSPLGVGVEVDVDALERDGQVRLWWDRNPVDLFFSYDPFHDEMQRSTRRVPFAETTIPILAPEHLAVCKAMFNRPKDWLDIEQILVAANPLDLPEIEAWLESMVGESDERLAHLREIVARLGA
jgi:Nucleotidyl transferase AbiEii toxin, Type IV TA system